MTPNLPTRLPKQTVSELLSEAQVTLLSLGQKSCTLDTEYQ